MTNKKSIIKRIGIGEFPDALREIPEPPESLSVLGKIPRKDALYLTVVGSRRFSNYGKDACEKIISGLAGSCITIVSGLALGIDSIAHKAAIKAGLPTIAFPGSGLNPEVLYPRSNVLLAQEIIQTGGSLVSEFPDNFRATPYSFPKRNRLMAGISRGILVIEAEEKSGTLITARLGLEYNKDVFAIPGSIFSPGSSGPNRLIREGAIPLSRGTDLLQHWNINPSADIHKTPADLTDTEQKIFNMLEEPLSKDEIMAATDLSITETNIALATLELRGCIVFGLGKIRRS